MNSLFISGVPIRYGMMDITWAEYCVGLIARAVGALAGPGAEATFWEYCVGPLAHVLEALGGPIVPALGDGAATLGRVMGAGTSKRASGRDSAGESAAPHRPLDNLLTIMRARADSSTPLYQMRGDDEIRMKDLFCAFGHLMRPEFELYVEFLGVCPRADASYAERSSILERMHESVKSRREWPNM